jgi:hypothetical protein
MADLFREIEIIGSLFPEQVAPGMISYGKHTIKVTKSVSAAEVIAAVDAAERDGVRALLLVIESPGGDSDAGLCVYNRLRRFSQDGGGVVAFVQGLCVSVAPIIVQAADLVLMRSDARLSIHGALGSGAAVLRSNEACARVLHERTGMSLERLRVYGSEPELCCQAHDLGSVRLGWADLAPATIEHARSFARLLGQGVKLPEDLSARRRHLATRELPSREAPSVVGALAHQTFSSDAGPVSVPHDSTRSTTHAIAFKTWTARTMPAGAWRSVAFGRGVFVAVGGANAQAATSPDAITWTKQTGLPSSFVASHVIWVEALGLFVAVGQGTFHVYTSTDGVTWSGRAFGYTESGAIDVAWTGTSLVVLGVLHVYTSPDAATWTQHAAPTVNVNTLVWNGARLLAVGIGGLSTSDDGGATWTTRTTPTGAGAQWNAGAFNGDVFCIAGMRESDGAAMTAVSHDAVTWTEYVVPDSAAGTVRLPSCLVWTGAVFFMLEITSSVSNSVCFTSADGRVWQLADAGVPLGAYNSPYVYGWAGACFGGGVGVAVTTDGVMTSAVV